MLRTGRDKAPRSSLATDELQYDFTPMWSSTMLGYIDALPGAESERAVDHGDIQRYASDHGLDMRRHIIGPFDVVDPAGIRRGKAIQCASAASNCLLLARATPQPSSSTQPKAGLAPVVWQSTINTSRSASAGTPQ